MKAHRDDTRPQVLMIQPGTQATAALPRRIVRHGNAAPIEGCKQNWITARKIAMRNGTFRLLASRSTKHGHILISQGTMPKASAEECPASVSAEC
ncbi:hypothetical protein [Methylobacillus flagellatus]|uniref:Uncharacterized protein n=1 Tax=Methylobacillus flagellatus (strain ATCC 51484 / DSM 6875 / VKM B-1610 / KT) TaxID=265072 RepID=Q1H4Z0_METFK|nr:hypothetical protein [Methylobacillus flagellatus]ABE48447.1 hypothetical protein Mfla_0176 [Methylobacillus flagellatus KT]